MRWCKGVDYQLAGLYKGFIATNGKEPIEKFKGLNSFRSYDEIKDLPEFAGVLQEDTVMIDIDDQEQSEKLLTIVEDLDLDCRITTTSRGRHFTFKNSGIDKCYTHVKLACGLIADIKFGGSCAEVLKYDGEERFCEWGNENPEVDDGYGALPHWLHPVNTKMDFLTTECRNSDLYGYILVLQTQLAMSNDECRQTIQIINDYILPEPLDQTELDVVLRDEAFEKPIFFDGKQFLHDAFARWLINQHHIKRINGQLHVYSDGVYVPGYRQIEHLMIQAFPAMKDAQRKEVLKYLEVICPNDEPVADCSLIAFANGIYDITTGVLGQFSPDIVITNRIPWEYHADAYSEIADHTLNKMAVQDPVIRLLLEECIGYCFFRRNEMSASIFLTGEKSNGKSTFLQMVQDVLGADNVSSLGLDEMDERFSVGTMAGKLANIGDDISDEFLHGRSIAHFKKIVSGNMVKAENKGQDVFFFKPTVKLIFSANQIPRMKDKTGAVLRRMIIIPFNAVFSKTDPDYDPYIARKLKAPEVMEYLCRIGIEGLKRILENKSFTKSEKVEREILEYTEYNNPILLFLKETEEDEINEEPTNLVYSNYELFCSANGFQRVGQINFVKDMRRYGGYATKQKRTGDKRERVFEKE